MLPKVAVHPHDFQVGMICLQIKGASCHLLVMHKTADA